MQYIVNTLRIVQCNKNIYYIMVLLYPRSPKGEGGILFYLCSSVQDIFRRTFLSNCWWQKSDILSQASYRYTILWVAFLDPSDSYLLFADLVGFYTHWTYMHIFRHIFLSYYWWQKSDIWSQASYSGKRFWTHQIPTSCLPKSGGYHKWALAHSSSCLNNFIGYHCFHLTFRKIWYCLIKTRIDLLSLFILM